jgi:hypothetical protein
VSHHAHTPGPYKPHPHQPHVTYQSIRQQGECTCCCNPCGLQSHHTCHPPLQRVPLLPLPWQPPGGWVLASPPSWPSAAAPSIHSLPPAALQHAHQAHSTWCSHSLHVMNAASTFTCMQPAGDVEALTGSSQQALHTLQHGLQLSAVYVRRLKGGRMAYQQGG